LILLDTNVLSEFMRVAPEPGVVAWLDAQPSDKIWICAVTRAEVELGIALLPEGRRKQGLKLQAEALFQEDFAGRCLPFDGVAAGHYARIVAARTAIGKPVSVEDAQIAAIALAHGLTLATRNVADCRNIEALVVMNPWDRK